MRLKPVLFALMPVLLLAIAACGSGTPKPPLLEAVRDSDMEAVQRHIDAGTGLNDTFVQSGESFAGASPLHLAVLAGDPEIALLLINNGADVNLRARDSAGGTPLHWAVFWANGDMAVLLMDKGADLTAKDNLGADPLATTYAENRFIPASQLEPFERNRTLIREFIIARLAR